MHGLQALKGVAVRKLPSHSKCLWFIFEGRDALCMICVGLGNLKIPLGLSSYSYSETTLSSSGPRGFYGTPLSRI